MRDADATKNILLNAARPPMLTFNKDRKYKCKLNVYKRDTYDS